MLAQAEQGEKSNAASQTKKEKEEEMKCLRCKSRGEQNPPDYKLHQHRDPKGREEVYMICPDCGHVPGSLTGKRR